MRAPRSRRIAPSTVRHLTLPLTLVLIGCGGGGGGGGTSSATADRSTTSSTNSTGSSGNGSVAVSITAEPRTVSPGERAWLSWTASGATDCRASGGWSGARPTGGSYRTPSLNKSTTFTISCNGSGGGAVARVTVDVLDRGNGSKSVELSASPRNVKLGGKAKLKWRAKGASSCTASGGWNGKKANSGSQSTGPLKKDTTFRLTCEGPNGNAVAMTTVQVRVATLRWAAPTENVDGSRLTDLSGYRVYWGKNSRNYKHSATIRDRRATSYRVELKSAGTHYFAVAAVDAHGNESAPSNEVSKTIH